MGGIDEEVHGFAYNDKSVLPQPWRRAKVAYPVNGFKNPSFQWLDKPAALAQHKHHHHHHTKDIGDQGIDEEVHGFAYADKSVLPQPWRRAKVAYPKNGFKNPKFQWLSQGDGDAEGGDGDGPKPTPVAEPEKVVDLYPVKYQIRANTNTPNKRTTFYAQ